MQKTTEGLQVRRKTGTKMIIPKRVHIAGQTYNVVQSKDIKLTDGEKVLDCNGICSPQINTIEISKGISDNKKEAVFLHEVVHAILHEMGSDMYEDEMFVSTFSNLLHQALTK